MNPRSLKVQIAAVFIILLSLSMFMLSCVWVTLTTKALIEEEIVLLESFADLAAKDIQAGDVACLRSERGVNRSSPRIIKSCLPAVEVGELKVPGGGGDKNVSYRGTQWAVLAFSHENLIVTKFVHAQNGELKTTIRIETSLEPIYQKIRDDWKIVIYYILINVIIFSSIGFFRLYRLVLKPIEKMVDISERYNSISELSFISGGPNSEFAKLSLGLNRMVTRIRDDNKALNANVESLATANKELKRNEKEMVRTEKLASVGRLAAGLAHEIGNPLGIIQGYVDMLGAREVTEQEKAEFSGRASRELQRIDKLIHQLLDISRKGSGEYSIVDINRSIAEVVDFFSLHKKNSRVVFELDLNAVNDRTAVVEDQLRQVFLNCLMNAVDSISENGDEIQGEIEISSQNIFIEEEEYIQIRIVDNGSGVNSGDLDNIFDPFFTTKETGKGTGLGLYVSYSIMENLGGRIRLNNLEPVGAEVVLLLPCCKKAITI